MHSNKAELFHTYYLWNAPNFKTLLFRIRKKERRKRMAVKNNTEKYLKMW